MNRKFLLYKLQGLISHMISIFIWMCQFGNCF